MSKFAQKLNYNFTELSNRFGYTIQLKFLSQIFLQCNNDHFLDSVHKGPDENSLCD
jgi:hypothetical protein